MPSGALLTQVGVNLVQHSKITMTFNRQQRSIEEAAIQVTVLLLLNFILQVLSTLSSMETQPCTYFTINSIKANFYDLQTESHEKHLVK